MDMAALKRLFTTKGKIRQNTIFGILLILLGLLLIFCSIRDFFVTEPQRAETYIEADAEITQVYENKDRKGNITYSADIRYRDETTYYTKKIAVPQGRKQGDAVRVRYNPEAPEQVEVVRKTTFLDPVFSIVICGIAIAYGVVRIKQAIRLDRET